MKSAIIYYGTNYCVNHKSGEKTVSKAHGEKMMKKKEF